MESAFSSHAIQARRLRSRKRSKGGAVSRRKRIILVLIALALLAVSLVALSYAFAPVQVINEQAPIAPTLLTLPAGGG